MKKCNGTCEVCECQNTSNYDNKGTTIKHKYSKG